MKDEISKEYLALIPNVFTHFSQLNRGERVLTHTQNHIVEYLFMQQRDLTLKEMSLALNISKQQMSAVVQTLESQDYLTKMSDEKDKRSVRLHLTEKGRQTQAERWEHLYARFTANLECLTAEEERDFAYALHKVNQIFTKMNGDEENEKRN